MCSRSDTATRSLRWSTPKETDTAEGFELPGADMSGEELSVRVMPKQADESTCSACFLVHHPTATPANGQVCHSATTVLLDRHATESRPATSAALTKRHQQFPE